MEAKIRKIQARGVLVVVVPVGGDRDTFKNNIERLVIRYVCNYYEYVDDLYARLYFPREVAYEVRKVLFTYNLKELQQND